MKTLIHWCLMLMVVMALTGCQTIAGTTTGCAQGLHKDIENTCTTTKKGINGLQKMDKWMQENMW